MMVRQLISNDHTPVKPQDTVQLALISMEELGVMNLPVVEDSKLVGYVRDMDIEAIDPSTTLSELQLVQPKFLDPDVSLFRALEVFSELGLDTVAVCTADSFIGSIWIKDLVRELGRSTTSQSDGAVLILRCLAKDYSISELGRLIESADGKLLGLWTWSSANGRSLELMIKLNIHQIDNLCLLVKAHGYEVVHVVSNYESELTKERYHSLLKYLDL